METQMSSLRRIHMTLARTKEHPEGSSRHGYLLVAPLNEAGGIDLAGWQEHRAACTVKRFWGDEPAQHGRLVHAAGGKGGARWIFDYAAGTDADDESGFRFDTHKFVPGEYVSLREPDGDLVTFKVNTVIPA
jgi:hypothetical protein